MRVPDKRTNPPEIMEVSDKISLNSVDMELTNYEEDLEIDVAMWGEHDDSEFCIEKIWLNGVDITDRIIRVPFENIVEECRDYLKKKYNVYKLHHWR